MKKRLAVIALVLGVMIGTMTLPSFAAGVSAPKATGDVGYTALGLQRYANFNAITTPGCPNVTGSWILGFQLTGDPTVYNHDFFLTQTGCSVSGNGGFPVGGPYQYAWNVTSGSVNGDSISLTIDYTVGAVGTTWHVSGTIASNGTMSGVWDDNFGGARTGTWASSVGAAARIAAKGTFNYSDVTGGWYTVDVQFTKVDGADAWFAGPVIAGNIDPGAGNLLFAKVRDGGEPSIGNDVIWGWFVSISAAVNGVAAGATPPGGEFAITSGNLQVH